jgi:TetR/AcrR family transcriptional regulator, fatty acid metabolism regulator protein
LTIRSETTEGAARKRTFIETARRAQIVAVAIDTIAELGYAQASLARIAERAGISKGVILYHFAGKDELVRELVREVLVRAEAYMRPRIGSAEQTGPGLLRAYIEANLAFMNEHRNHMVAMAEIARSARDAEGNRTFDASFVRAGVAATREFLARFQGQGQFRDDFDPMVMAMAIRAVIDAVPARLARDPGLDLDHYGRELADLFLRATRPGSS